MMHIIGQKRKSVTIISSIFLNNGGGAALSIYKVACIKAIIKYQSQFMTLVR